MKRWHGLGILLGIFFSLPVLATEEWALDTEWISQTSQTIFDVFAPPHIQDEYAVYSAEELDGMLKILSATLRGDDLADLASHLNEAEQLLAILQQTPFMQGYANWLETRMDYFEVAQEAIRQFPLPSLPLPTPSTSQTPSLPPSSRPSGPILPASTRPASLPPPTTPASMPETKPLPSTTAPPSKSPQPSTPTASNSPVVAEPPPAIVVQERNRYADDKATWIRKLGGRPMPTKAPEYLPELKRIFAAEGLPPQLVWQAEAESSFNPNAKSPVGAAGLYQFMPATAQTYGLRLSPRDERLDPYKNAAAAAKYLRYLHGRFQSWPLALAAYNCGEGRISNTLKKHGAATFEAIQGSLPTETQMYVPKIAALIQIRENADLDRLPAPRIAWFSMPHSISLAWTR